MAGRRRDPRRLRARSDMPITEQVSHFAMDHADHAARAARRRPGGHRGGQARRAMRRARRSARRPTISMCSSICAAGLNFGYYYDASPIIAYDGEAPPAILDGQFHALHRARLPHAAPLAARRTLALRRARRRITPCCASIRALDAARVASAPRRCAACRWRYSMSIPMKRSIPRNWCSRAPTSTSPGGGTQCRATRSSS